MSIGALAFLNPWLLAALLALPLIYWLLRTVPPRPRRVEFPPTRILVGLDNREKTPAKTPWWLMLIRLAAAALVIFALADPVLNPTERRALKGSGPVVVAIDNGWSSASHWTARQTAAERIIDTAQSQGRPVVIAATAYGSTSPQVRIEAPVAARATLAALQPEPFAPNRAGVVEAMQKAIGASTGGTSIVWLTDGIDHGGEAAAFVDRLVRLADGGSLAVISDVEGSEALGVAAYSGEGGRLEARIVRSGGGARSGQVHALSARGERLGEAAFSLSATEPSTTAVYALPLELRNQVTRVEIAGERSAGAVSLIDASAQWHRVGLLSGSRTEDAQPLLAPLYYIEKALAPYAEIVRSKDANLAAGIEATLKQNATVLVLADIGTLSGDIADRVTDWVKRGGVLVRFAGPRLEKGGDDLLPVPLRVGGRTLGGSLSWSTPQALAGFDDASPFAGLVVPPDVAVSRQVLADPQRLGPDVGVWARLQDGTPLVTARQMGQGRIVLFHVTANSDWSNLPLSGVFVDMLRRLATLGRLAAAPSETAGATALVNDATATPQTADLLTPRATLDGYGILSSPPPTAEPVAAHRLAETPAGPKHPPGLYGPEGASRALNVLTQKSSLNGLPPLPAGVEQMGYEQETTRTLKPTLLAAALGLVFADIVAVLLLSLGGLALFRRRASAASGAALLLVAAGFALATDAFAQSRDAAAARSLSATDQLALQATGKVTLGYVLSGNAAADEASRQGLSGLSRVLAARTAVTPGDPLPVDILNDEIAFFPVLYWPVLEDADPLPEATMAKIDAYMKQGGMIVFDTRDYGSGRPNGMSLTKRDQPLQRIIGRLDIPRLEPVPDGHVLTKSFYLLRSFPGRWDGGQMWVEADVGNSDADQGGRQARRADGVTSIVITSNDLAAAWALDERGRPIYPVVPGGEAQREMAFRAGVNLVIHALTGNYKADQVHVPALLERLGQ